MNKDTIIIYGSCYGTTKTYAEELSRRLDCEAVPYEDAGDINIYQTIIYMGGLYAGGVRGMRKTMKRLHDISSQRILIATVGLADPENEENIAAIRKNIKAQVSEVLAGRNFGLGGSDTLCLYTHPQGGYAAVASVSTDMIAVGQGNEYETESLWGRAALLAAPYMGVDGMNEKGLTASLLDVDFGEEHMHTDNPDLTVTMAIRLLLDRAATVSEAVELLRGYDIHTGHGWTQHIFVADANGDAAVIEWHNEKMRVTESPVCTNFRMSNKTFEGNYKGACERFDLLAEALEKQPRNTAEDSMQLLEAVKQEYADLHIFTEWSVVFHLTDFTVDYAVNMDYDTVYHLNPKDF